MKTLTPERLRDITGGQLTCPEDLLGKEITSIETDSRKVTEGSLFAAFVGERVDANAFIPQVMEKGALLVLTEHPEKASGYPCLAVPSVLEALQRIARSYLKVLGTPVISITGSVGKTSTKETLAAILSTHFRTLKTPGNFNNDLGLPLTVFQLREETEMAVLEMGISHFGDMTTLASIAPPDVSVITNIGTCHLEFLGDRDGVFKAKTEVFDLLKEGGRCVLNGDDDKLRQVTEVKGRKPLFFGLDPSLDVYADHIVSLGLDGTRCEIHLPDRTFTALIPMPGEHMVRNALAGCAVAWLYGLTTEEMVTGLASLESIGGRFHILKKAGLTIIDDAYNANPMSMKASLGVLRYASGRRVAILGDMGELGQKEEALHREVGAYLAENAPELLVTAGPLSKALADEAHKSGATCRIRCFDDTEGLVSALADLIQKDDTVLVKASHFMHFERVVEALGQ